MTDNAQKLFKATDIDYLQHDGPVTVVRDLGFAARRHGPRADVGPLFLVRSASGVEFKAFADELTDIPTADTAQVHDELPTPPGEPSLGDKLFQEFIERGRDDWPDVGANAPHLLRPDTSASPKAELPGSDAPEPIILSEDDISIERNNEYIDVRMHDDSRPEHWPSIFASLTLDEDSARRVGAKLLTAAGPTIEEIVQRVLNETPDGAAFDLNDALRLAAQIGRGEV